MSMRWVAFGILLGLLWLGGCGHMPMTSMVRLAKVDLASTDLSRLRAAVRTPRGLSPRPDQSRLRVTVRIGENAATQEFRLSALPEDGSLTASAETQVTVFAINPRELARAEVFRDELKLRQKASGRSGGQITIEVAPDMCRTGALANGPLLFTTYLQTAETGSFVVLAQDVDLRTLAGRDLVEKIPICS